jgi:hypothetical protein
MILPSLAKRLKLAIGDWTKTHHHNNIKTIFRVISLGSSLYSSKDSTYETHRFIVSLIGDLMFVASLFVLGGDFWDKLRALFIHSAGVQVAAKKLN